MKRFGVLVGALFAVAQVLAGGDVSLQSRSALFAYYNQPKTYSTVKVRSVRTGIEVEICAGVCDAFFARVAADNQELWDAIFLFKAIVSRAEDDQAFSKQRRSEAAELLDRMTRSSQCRSQTDARSKALCALRRFAVRSGFGYAEVKYDEGNRCAVYRSLDAHSRILRSSCSKVGP